MARQNAHAASIADGMRELYNALKPKQLAIYHRVSADNGLKIWEAVHSGRPPCVRQEDVFKLAFVQGGFRSGKTHADCVRQLGTKLNYAGHDSIVVRKHHETLRNSYLLDFKNVIWTATQGNPDWLILDESNADGAVELTIRGPGKPGRIIFKIEPDGDEMKVKNAFKGYSTIADFTAEECNELLKRTVQMLIIRLSRNDIPVGGTCITNPDFDDTWVAKDFEKYQQELAKGKRPLMVPILTETEEVKEYLAPTYIAEVTELYKDDPVGLAMALKGTTGVRQIGRPVFQGFFFEDRHVDDQIRFNPDLPLSRGWDFGHTVGAGGFWQMRKDGSAYKIAELQCEGASAEQFAEEMAAYTAKHFPPGIDILDCGDPAGRQEKDTGASIRVIERWFKDHGQSIHIRTMHHGLVENGLDHMRMLLSENRGAHPRLAYHPRCEITIRAMKYGYYYKIFRDNRVQEIPFKDGKHDHHIDQDRYNICHMIPVANRNQERNDGPITARGVVDIRRARAEKTMQDWAKEKIQSRGGFT